MSLSICLHIFVSYIKIPIFLGLKSFQLLLQIDNDCIKYAQIIFKNLILHMIQREILVNQKKTKSSYFTSKSNYSF